MYAFSMSIYSKWNYQYRYPDNTSCILEPTFANAPWVLMHHFLSVRLSVCSPEDTVVGCSGHNLGTGGVWTDPWGAKSTCGVQLAKWHADINKWQTDLATKVHVQGQSGIQQYMPSTIIKVYDTGRWAHINVKLLHPNEILLNTY